MKWLDDIKASAGASSDNHRHGDYRRARGHRHRAFRHLLENMKWTEKCQTSTEAAMKR